MNKLVDGIEVPLTQAEIDEYNQRELDFQQLQTQLIAIEYQREREILYNERGATIEALIVARIEADLEGRPDALNNLQAIRLQVKSEIPKPV